MKFFIFTLFIAGACSLSAKKLPPVPELTVQRCSVAPKIDGRIDDPAWKNATEIPHLVQNNSKHKNTHLTRILVTCDAENLYVAFICNEPDMEGLTRKKATEVYDGPVWKDDCVEIYLGDAETPEVFTQYVVNWAGGRFDGIVFPGKVGHPMQFHNLKWESAVSHNKNEWIVEFAIPFFNANIKASTKSFRINFFRVKYHPPGETLAWSRTHERIFAVPHRFGVIHIPPMADGLPEITSVNWPKFVLRPHSEATITLQSPIAWNGELVAAYIIGDSAPVEYYKMNIALEKNKKLTVEYPLGEKMTVAKAAFLVGFRQADKLFWRKHRTLELYDNFKLERSPTIIVAGKNSVAVAIFRDTSKGEQLEYKIKNEKGEILSQQEFASKPRIILPLPTAKLEPGRYTLCIETDSGNAERPFTVISGIELNKQ